MKTNMHDVVKIEISNTRRFTTDSGWDFFVRDFVFTDKNGFTYTLTALADAESDLLLTREPIA